MTKFLAFFTIFFCLAFEALAQDKGVLSFMYHRINENKPSLVSTNVKLEMFQEHIRLLEESKYGFISAQQFKDYVSGKIKFQNIKILLTIDDSFKSFYDNGWPILKQKKIPFILFVNTREVNINHPNYMTWEQIRELKRSGLVTIGGHSFSHEYFVNMSIEEIDEDIKKSQIDYQREIGEISDIFSHPFGETNTEIISLLKKRGYKIMFGQHSGVISLKENINYLPRFSMNENYGKIQRFKRILRSRPFDLKDYQPKITMLKDENPINIKLFFNENVKGINCFDNSGGEWKNTEISFVNNNDIELLFKVPFKKRRGRVNCTLPIKNKLIKWWGYQYSVLK